MNINAGTNRSLHIYAILLLLTSVMLSSGCDIFTKTVRSHEPAVTLKATEVPIGLISYKDSNSGIAFCYPKNWTVETADINDSHEVDVLTEEGRMALQLYVSENVAGIPNFDVYSDDEMLSLAAGLWSTYSKQLAEAYDIASDPGLSVATINGNQYAAIKVNCRKIQDETNYLYALYMIVYDNKMYTIIYTCNTESSQTENTMLDSIIHSIQLPAAD